MIISIGGKGGTGKTTIATLMIDYLIKNRKGSILAIDADPNSNLGQMVAIQPAKSVVELVDEVAQGRSNIPNGFAKKDFFEYKIHESIVESDGLDLLNMGRPEGPGCYCYVNDLLRQIIDKLSKSYDYTVLDNEAGMEHLSRRTTRRADIFFIVSDNTPVGIRSARRIYELIRELKLVYKKVYLIVNKAAGSTTDLMTDIKKSDLELIGIVPESSNLYNLSLKERPLTELSDPNVIEAVKDICKKADI